MPGEGQGPGTFPVTFTATDSGTPAMSDSETIALTGREVNVAPTLGLVVDKVAAPSQALEDALTIQDEDVSPNTLD